jgi:hypothetical protein
MRQELIMKPGFHRLLLTIETRQWLFSRSRLSRFLLYFSCMYVTYSKVQKSLPSIFQVFFKMDVMNRKTKYSKTSFNEHLYRVNTSYLNACLGPPDRFLLEMDLYIMKTSQF